MRVAETIGDFLVVYSSWTLLVYVLVIGLIFFERSKANIVFYVIYMAGSIADIFALINGIFTYCGLTDFLHLQFLRNTSTLRVSHIIVWGSRFNQLLTVLLIAMNRLTAIHCSLRYSFIWTRKRAHFCAFFQIASILIYGTVVTHVLQPVWANSSFGGVVAEFSIRTSLRDKMFTVSLLIQFTMSLAILVCYLAMIRAVRTTLRKISDHKSQPRNEVGLHAIALIICTVEILTLLLHIVSNQFEITNETRTCVYIVQTVIYNSIPPYLLLAFSKGIRSRASYLIYRTKPLLVQNIQLFTVERRDSSVLPR